MTAEVTGVAATAAPAVAAVVAGAAAAVVAAGAGGPSADCDAQPGQAIMITSSSEFLRGLAPLFTPPAVMPVLQELDKLEHADDAENQPDGVRPGNRMRA
jgi:subtilisin family serine protease